MNFPPNWLDKNGLVMPQPNSDHSDNGILFTSVAVVLGFDIPNYRDLVRSCYLKKGLVARWQKNDYDQAAWDDYLGIAVACLYLRETKIPREILWYGVKHWFVYNTDKKLEGKDWLGRHPTIWPLMFCAAFPWVSFWMFWVQGLVQLFFKDPVQLVKENNTSGFQLQWMFYRGCLKSGNFFDGCRDHERVLSDALKIYYHKDHPFNTMGLQ